MEHNLQMNYVSLRSKLFPHRWTIIVEFRILRFAENSVTVSSLRSGIWHWDKQVFDPNFYEDMNS
jgi:hypothetical protein